MKIYYKQAIKYMHLYAESQKKIESLIQDTIDVRNQYIKALDFQKELLHKIISLECELTHYKIQMGEKG